ncbi:DUF2325 domain-containing protein [Bordetella sp. FB-8]|uniref:DUF2325 domain-containing protein n=1 Tax=Bordetella sp. FB-8 TaxID=1159870 RepID=UPI00035F3EF7|nr:DUF2325 domain-containing protein [Bordetella sp. FB-8]
MCEQCKPDASDVPGSRRRRLWDLPHACHCPVIGVCLPLNTLRTLVNKTLGGQAQADDYEIHVGAVAECMQRNRLSKRLQDELDRRYARDIQALRTAKTALDVAQRWTAAIRQGDVAGTFWAALTHPRSDDVLRDVLLRDMHMLQHQAGAATRMDIARFKVLQQAHADLEAELEKTRSRHARALADRQAENESLSAEVLQLRTEGVARQSQFAALEYDMQRLKASLVDYTQADRLQKKIELLAARQAELEAQNQGLRQRLAQAGKTQATPVPTSTRAVDAAHEATAVPQLKDQVVLCVGGRNGNLANYRAAIEDIGGRFAHHDGGLQDKHGALDASLAAADLVICQTGCISHNAYWRVKDFCKRTGKRCLFVENPSTSSLVRELRQSLAPEKTETELIQLG